LQVPHVRSYLIGWSANSVSEWAAARALTGEAPITGRMPVRLPPKYPLGHGLVRWQGTRP
jgi:predicted DNA-binding transcriptional regulator AlpA